MSGKEKVAGTTANTDPSSVEVQESLLTRGKQLGNAYKEALKNNDHAKADQILKDLVFLGVQSNVLTKSNETFGKMLAAAPELRADLMKKMQAGGDKAFMDALALQLEANQKKQEMYKDEIDRMYQARLSAADGPAKLLASFKGFALLLQAFGVDCSDFIADMDKKINEEYAKVPKKDIEGLSDVNAYSFNIKDPAQYLKAMTDEGLKISRTLGETVEESTRDALKSGQKISGSKPAAAAGNTPKAQSTEAPVDTSLVATAMAQIIAEKKLITSDKERTALNADLQKGLAQASQFDGDSKTVSSRDVVAVATTAESLIKAHGGKVDAEAATLLTKQAIERAKVSSALAGIPQPQPT